MASGKKPPPIMPAVIAPGGPTDIMTAFYKNRVIFIGSNINSQLAQKVISQLLALEAIDPKSDIKVISSLLKAFFSQNLMDSGNLRCTSTVQEEVLITLLQSMTVWLR